MRNLFLAKKANANFAITEDKPTREKSGYFDLKSKQEPSSKITLRVGAKVSWKTNKLESAVYFLFSSQKHKGDVSCRASRAKHFSFRSLNRSFAANPASLGLGFLPPLWRDAHTSRAASLKEVRIYVIAGLKNNLKLTRMLNKLIPAAVAVAATAATRNGSIMVAAHVSDRLHQNQKSRRPKAHRIISEYEWRTTKEINK